MNYETASWINMSRSIENKISYFIDSFEPIKFSELDKNLDVDVTIVGGGIAGLTTAYLLSEEGKSIALVESGWIGTQEVLSTTAHIVNAIDNRFYNLEKFYGEEGAKLAIESRIASIKLLQNIIEKEKINCGFERMDGYLFLDTVTNNKQNLRDELNATQRTGINTELLDFVPGITAENLSCLRFPDQAQLYPMAYLKGLCAAIQNKGGRLYTNTCVNIINSSEVITDKGYKIKTKNIVLASNTFSNNILVMPSRLSHRSYIIGAKIPKASLPRALWWDTGGKTSKWPAYPYHYARVHDYTPKFDLLVCAGEDHNMEQIDSVITDRFTLLKNWAKNRFPMLGDIIYKWSGPVIETVSAVVYVGRNSLNNDNVYIATGDSESNLTLGTMSAMILTDLIVGRSNSWEELYNPRKILSKVSDNSVFNPDKIIAHSGKNLPSEECDMRNAVTREAVIIKRCDNKVAVFKDRNNKVHTYSSICPYQECSARWNDEQRLYECACSNSQFDCYIKINKSTSYDTTKSTRSLKRVRVSH